MSRNSVDRPNELEFAPERRAGKGWHYCQIQSRNSRCLCGRMAEWKVYHRFWICGPHRKKLEALTQQGELEIVSDPRDSSVYIVRVRREGTAIEGECGPRSVQG